MHQEVAEYEEVFGEGDSNEEVEDEEGVDIEGPYDPTAENLELPPPNEPKIMRW